MWLSIREIANYTLWERKGTVLFLCMPDGCMHRNNRIYGHIFRVDAGNCMCLCAYRKQYTRSLLDMNVGIRICNLKPELKPPFFHSFLKLFHTSSSLIIKSFNILVMVEVINRIPVASQAK